MARTSPSHELPALPRFIEPMLAKPGMPFDSDQYLFEIKWDGTRTLAFIETGSYRLVNRRHIDLTSRYPEFAFLSHVPAGTVLDGEVVVLRDGKPSFPLLMSREQAQAPLKVRSLSRSMPATYMAFDLLYQDFESITRLRLRERRERLARLVKAVNDPQFLLSDGVIGHGKRFFEEACRHGLEGVIAKRLESRYLAGRRTDAWIKIKRRSQIHCLVLGFLPSGKDDFRSLIIAAQDDGKLRCVGKVGTGFNASLRKRLNAMLWSRLRSRPLIPCKIKGKWVEPDVYCRVSFMERTSGGELRAPVFEELCE